MEVDFEIVQMRRERYNELSEMNPEKGTSIFSTGTFNLNQVQYHRPSGMIKTQTDPERALESLEHAAQCEDKSCGSEGCIKFETSECYSFISNLLE